MIGGITKGSCFSGCVEYVLALKEKNKEARLLYSEGLLTDTPKDIVDGFECQRHLNNRVQHWCGHISLSYSPEDSARLSDEVMVKLALEYMERMGIKNTQFIIARHLDKEHPHCHIVFSRIDLDGNVISAFNERIRSAKVCKEIKLRHGLTFGNMTGEKVNRDRLRPIQQLRFNVKSAAIAAANNSSSWAEFQHALEAHGIEASFNINRSTGEIRGISFAKDNYMFAGSKLSKQKLTYGKLVAKFGALPVEGVAVLSTLSTGHRFNSEGGTGKSTAPYRDSSKGGLCSADPISESTGYRQSGFQNGKSFRERAIQ